METEETLWKRIGGLVRQPASAGYTSVLAYFRECNGGRRTPSEVLTVFADWRRQWVFEVRQSANSSPWAFSPLRLLFTGGVSDDTKVRGSDDKAS